MNYRRVSQNMLEFTQPSTYRIQNSKEKKREPLTMNKAKAHTHPELSHREREEKTRSKWYLHNSENFGSI